MGRKKKDENKHEEDASVVSNPNAETETKSSPIYLADTLIEMEEIKKYGLNKYFLRSILSDKFYTLEQAHALLKKAVEG